MDAQQIKALMNKGLIITRHTLEKMQKESITKDDIREVLLSGLSSHVDSSIRNDKSFAWNSAPHNTISYRGLTVVFCESLEHACLIISVYHGLPHNYLSNPHNRVNGQYHNYNLRSSNLKIFR